MRIRALHLTRYGKFTDRVVDFGPQRPGKPDLHILYGPNEAGKSTKVSAWLDLLFGIPERTRHAFLHPGPTMRIGAVLDLGGRQLSVARVKRRDGSLIDAFDAPLPEAAIQGHLGGLDRAAYCAMFSLDDDTLKEGGDSILQARGDLGQLLFSSSAGIAGLSARLGGLRDDPQAFHRPGARSGPLVELKRKLDAAEAERRAIDADSTAQAHRRLTETLARAEAAWREAGAAREGLAARAAQLDRVAAALPLLDRLDAIEAALAALPDLPQVPGDWPAEAERREAARAQAASQAGEVGRSLAVVEARIADLAPDPGVMALADRIAALAALRSGHDEAVKDLPARHDELALRDTEIAAGMRRLGAGGPVAEVLVPVAAMAGLRRLVEARSGVAARLGAAEAEAGAAVAARIDAEARAGAAGPSAAVTERLALLLARLRARDPDAALRQAGAARAQAAGALDRRIAAMAPWRGAAETLGAMQVPPQARLDALAARIGAAATALREAEAALAALREAGAAGAGPGAEPDGPGDHDLVAARAARERAWAAHRAVLTGDTAEAFETAMRLDDRLAEARARAEADSALRAEARAAAARHAARLEAASGALDAARAGAEAAAADLRATIRAISPDLPGEMALPDLRDWLGRRDAALAAAADHADAAAGHARAEADRDDAALALRQALGDDAAATDLPYDLLVAHAQALADAGAGAAMQTAALATARDLERRREADLARARAADDGWRADWARLCGPTCLAGDAGDDTGASARALDVLDGLRALSEARDALADRIAKMEVNRSAFRAGLADLATALGLAADDPAAGWEALTDRLGGAQAARQALRVREAEREAMRERLGALQATVRDHAEALARMAGALGVEGYPALHERLAQCAERDRLRREAGLAADELVQRMRTGTPEEARAQLRRVDADRLDGDRMQVGAELEAAQTASETTFAAVSAARAALRAVGDGDDAARLEERRQTLLMEVREGAIRHLRRRFGIIALDHALRAYRDCNRSAMMTHASDAFRTISRNAYTGLDTQSDRDREFLIAKAADGTSKLATDLSKGTHFQLYLALRVAGYHVLAAARTPVPFIADDIMETFDDDRSAEAFRLLGGMARVGQVIYLTHHRHLCDIARDACAGAVIHDLSATDAPAPAPAPAPT